MLNEPLLEYCGGVASPGIFYILKSQQGQFRHHELTVFVHKVVK